MTKKITQEIDIDRDILVGLAGSDNWLTAITHATYDASQGILGVRFDKEKDWPEMPTTYIPISLVERDYPGIHQALRVAQATCITAKFRARALAGWSYLLGPDITTPVFLFKDGTSYASAASHEWDKTLTFVSLSQRQVSMDIETNPQGTTGNAGRGARFQADVVEANFPGMIEVIQKLTDLGLSSFAIAEQFKMILRPDLSAAIALPGLEPT
jgi:hypothetical protein